MRSLSASDATLVIQVPTWIGLVLVGAGVAVTVAVLVLQVRRPVRLGAFLATIVLLYGGWYALATSTTFERRGYYVAGMLGEEERMGWLQVSGIEQGRGTDPSQLTLQLRSGSETTVDLSGLSSDEKARVIAFVRARLNR